MSRGEIYKSGWGNYRLEVASASPVTLIAAETASAGHLFALQWTDTKNDLLIAKVRATWQTVVGFTAGQEVGLDWTLIHGVTAPHTGGTTLAPTAGAFKTRSAGPSAQPDTRIADMRITSGTALTVGTIGSFDPFPFAVGGATELAAGAAVQMQKFVCEYDGTNNDGQPLRLVNGDGILLRNRVLMGAAGTARITVAMDWIEIPRTFQ